MAFEMVPALRALIDMVNEHIQKPIKATARLDDIMSMLLDIAADVRASELAESVRLPYAQGE